LISRSGAKRSDTLSLDATSELRLVDADDDDLVLQWMSAEDEAEGETLRVPRTLLDQIDANPGWQGLREQLQGRAWVDLNRLLITEQPRPPSPPTPADDGDDDVDLDEAAEDEDEGTEDDEGTAVR